MPSWDEVTPYMERDTTSRRWNAVNVLIGLNIAGFILPALALLFKAHEVARVLTFDWQLAIKKAWLWQFLTYTFWHPMTGGAGNQVDLLWSVLGLAFGCWILHREGRELESEWGWKRFTAFYLGSAVYGAVFHALYQAVRSSNFTAFDFLGPVLAVFLVWALRHPNAGIRFFFFFEMKAITAALAFIGLVFLYCLAGYNMGYTPIAALGGAAGGYLLYKLEPKLDAFLDARAARAARRRFLDDFEVKKQVDVILDKINREGIGNLTPAERRILKQASNLYGGEEGGAHE